MTTYQLTSSDSVIRTKDGAIIPNDPANRDRQEYDAWVKKGGVPDPHVLLPVVVLSVTPRQARLALFGAGLLDRVEAAVKQAGGVTQISWEYATVINRDDELIVQIAAGLKLSDEQIDSLFEAAVAL